MICTVAEETKVLSNDDLEKYFNVSKYSKKTAAGARIFAPYQQSLCSVISARIHDSLVMANNL